MAKLILASKSPRRSELLSMLGLTYTVRSADTDESLPAGISPHDAVLLLARRKALASAAHSESEDEIVLAADTLVSIDGEILGKPTSKDEAKSMLRRLSGISHTVYSGIALARDGQIASTVAETEVRFRTLDEVEIERYVATGEPMDKAGGYGIQGAAGIFIESISGDYYNVVGLPLSTLEELCKSFLGSSIYAI